MLNYMGPVLGNRPMAAQLPPALPGTMPSGVPGVSPSPAPLPVSSPVVGRGAPSPAAMAAIQAGPPGQMPGAPPQPPSPADIQYQAVTQADGSILLHIKMPDGELGPAVKIIPPPKNVA